MIRHFQFNFIENPRLLIRMEYVRSQFIELGSLAWDIFLQFNRVVEELDHMHI